MNIGDAFLHGLAVYAAACELRPLAARTRRALASAWLKRADRYGAGPHATSRTRSNDER
jgi:hypothetical protein